MSNVLFILKRRPDFDPAQHTAIGMQTGLYNSAKFMNDMLNDSGIQSSIEVVIDNNCIDRVVTQHKPKYAIIEALWVVPTKFEILSKLHPNVTWIVRIHSETPFIAGEGMAYEWICGYAKCKNVVLAVNSPRMMNDVSIMLSSMGINSSDRVMYLPNYYPQNMSVKSPRVIGDNIHIGCFGAIRPLKNHLLQALSAIKFADTIGKKLYFHINGRVEGKGEPILNNLKGVFINLFDMGHRLVFHPWVTRDDFIIECGKLDIGMQVSFSETFNIVSADKVSQGVPLVVSSEVIWANRKYCADPTSVDSIFNALMLSYNNMDDNVKTNQEKLITYTNNSKLTWMKNLK